MVDISWLTKLKVTGFSRNKKVSENVNQYFDIKNKSQTSGEKSISFRQSI